MKTTKETLEFINSTDRVILNVTEWCKKDACWERAKKINFELIDEFVKTLIDKETENEVVKEAKMNRELPIS